MSLNYTLDKIKDYQTVCWVDPETIGNPLKALWTYSDEKAMNPSTFNLIWATMAIGIGEITEANAEEFFCRLRLWEKLIDVGTLTSYEDVKKHIGLHTNVFPKESKTKFLEKMYHQVLRYHKT